MHLFPALVLALVASAACAFGLGAPVGAPLLGKPLRLAIPLTGYAGPPLGDECLSLANSATSTEALYFPRAARAHFETRQGSPFVVVVAPGLTQPVVEFNLTVDCGQRYSRDFVLLTEVSEPDPDSASVFPAPPGSPLTLVAPLAASAARVEPAPGELLRLPEDKTLEAVAREKYPLQPKAREKFMRMLQEANAEQIRPGAGFELQVLPGGSVLTLPPGLPAQRHAAGEPASRRGPAREPAAALPANKPAVRRAPPQDRLVLGAAAMLPTAAGDVDAMRERLIAINAEQVTAQEELTERIARAQRAFAEVKHYIASMEAQIRVLEAERNELARKGERAQIWQLAASVFFGGVFGAGILHVYPRLVLRRKADFPSV